MTTPFEVWANGPTADLTIPSISQQDQGFVCGPADPAVFNQMFNWLTSQAQDADLRIEALESNDLSDDASVATLVATVNQQGVDIDAVEAFVISNDARITVLESSQVTQDVTIGSILSDLSSAESDIAQNTADIATLQGAPALLTGSMVLIEEVDFSSITLTGTGTLAEYRFPLFDPLSFIGYELEIVGCQAFTGGALFELLTTIDGGATYLNTDAITRTLFDNGTGGAGTSSFTALHSEDNTTISETFSGRLRIMRPDLTSFTQGDYEIRRSDGAGSIFLQRGLYQHGLATPVNGISLRRINEITSGFMYLRGIVA